MDDLIKHVRSYLLAASRDEQLRLADEIFALIVLRLGYFVSSEIPHPAANEVLQDILLSIEKSLVKFQRSTSEEFWSWCFTIARRRICDHLRKKKSDRLQPMLPEDLIREADKLMRVESVSPEIRDELEYALGLLRRSKPECVKYLWSFYILGLDDADIAQEQNIAQAAARMRIKRCLKKAQSLVA